MMIDDNDGQMIFGDLGGLKFPDICLTGEEKNPKNLTQETCPYRGSNPGPLRDKRACYLLVHSGGRHYIKSVNMFGYGSFGAVWIGRGGGQELFAEVIGAPGWGSWNPPFSINLFALNTFAFFVLR